MRETAFRHRIDHEEFDYQTLLDALSGYSQPRSKISALLRDKVIVRVKKGLYVYGETERRTPLCPELLANLVYGPSYVSLEYALGWHGMIPERVETVTSVTTGRGREFDTPVGRFTYRGIPMAVFPVGVNQVETGDGRAFLMASPEKALADALVSDRGGRIASRREMATLLAESLRIDESRLRELDPHILGMIADRYGSRKVRFLADLVVRLRKGVRG